MAKNAPFKGVKQFAMIGGHAQSVHSALAQAMEQAQGLDVLAVYMPDGSMKVVPLTERGVEELQGIREAGMRAHLQESPKEAETLRAMQEANPVSIGSVAMAFGPNLADDVYASLATDAEKWGWEVGKIWFTMPDIN